MTTKNYTLPIEGFPEGWEPIAYRKPEVGEFMLRDKGIRLVQEHHLGIETIIVQKNKPRRIVLEETGNANNQNTTYKVEYEGIHIEYRSNKVWNVVKEE